MKRKLTETELRNAIYERVKAAITEGFESDGRYFSSAIEIKPQYRDFMMAASHIIAWKGADFNVQVGGIEFETAKKMVDEFINKKVKAKERSGSSEEAKRNLKALRERWRSLGGVYEEVVDSERDGVELFKAFNKEGFDYISKHIGSKTDEWRQKQKSSGLALFGVKCDFPPRFIANGAVFCLRDFAKWIENGRPSVDAEDDGRVASNSEELSDIEQGDEIRNSHEEEVNEGRMPDESVLHNEEKAQLVENTRKMKILLAESYDLADRIDDFRSKKLFGKILEAILKYERDPKKVELMMKAGIDDDE